MTELSMGLTQKRLSARSFLILDSSLTIKIAGLVEESVVDGKGIRFTIFVQGCPHRCFNCHNPQTHDIEGGDVVALNEIYEKIKANPLLDGITLSGGEPFLYAKELATLCKRVKALGLNVWCYTGFTYEELNQMAKKDESILVLLNQIDVLVDGRYEDDKRDLMLKFRGSSNQRVINLAVMRESKSGKVIQLEL